MSTLLAAATRIRLINLRELRTHRLRVLTSLSVVVVSSAMVVVVPSSSTGTSVPSSVMVADCNVLPGLQLSIWTITTRFSPSTSLSARLPVWVPPLSASTVASDPGVPLGLALLKIEIWAASSMLTKSTVNVLGDTPGGTVVGGHQGFDAVRRFQQHAGARVGRDGLAVVGSIDPVFLDGLEAR